MPGNLTVASPNLHRRHHQRLREVYRSSGWPCQDMLEVELLASGLLERRIDTDGRETLRVTDAGLVQLAQAHVGNKAARSAHEALVERVCLEMGRAGRLVSRADLLGDLKKPGKRAAYLGLGGECWYVLGQTGQRQADCAARRDSARVRRDAVRKRSRRVPGGFAARAAQTDGAHAASHLDGAGQGNACGACGG